MSKSENPMTRNQTILGWIYFPIHMIALPLLLNVLAVYWPGDLDNVSINLLYFAVGMVFVLTVMLDYLRECFHIFLDGFLNCLITILLALAMEYALTFLVTLLFLLLGDLSENPNNSLTLEMFHDNPGAVRAMIIFLAPLVEEPLFRGVVFGSIRQKNRAVAYIVSTLLFGFMHVWQYALATHDLGQLLYAVQYIPLGLVFAWCYDRTGTIWTPILLHMMMNVFSLSVLSFIS